MVLVLARRRASCFRSALAALSLNTFSLNFKATFNSPPSVLVFFWGLLVGGERMGGSGGGADGSCSSGASVS